MAVSSTDVKEMWCTECDFRRTYDQDEQAEGDYARDWRKWKRGGCPQCGHDIRTDCSPAHADQS